MRFLKNRPMLSKNAGDRLKARSTRLMSSPDPAAICEQRFNDARDTRWFKEIRGGLMDMAGASRTCMFCDHNEPTDVEHFMPKSVFPDQTFEWVNMLWICTTCNRLKGVKFPPRNCAGAAIINPTVDPVWNFFFLDEFGNLIKRWNANANSYDARAQSTCNYAKVDREEVQTRRQKRAKGLRSSVQQAIKDLKNQSATLHDVNTRIADWLAEPFQADVADYFFRGPGNASAPFSDLLAQGVTIPPP